MKVFRAQCERDARHWLVDIPELRIHTFGRDLDDAREMARDAIAGVLGCSMRDVDVELEIAGTSEALAEAEEARADRARAASREAAALRTAIQALLSRGASQRDAARLLGISHQRVSQIVSKYEITAVDRGARRSSSRPSSTKASRKGRREERPQSG